MMDLSKMHLIHGGHKGTEAAFGRAAELHGVRETTLSFEGHKAEREVNVENLSDDELRKGRVSLEFVFQRMGRRFVKGTGIRRVLKMMFQVVVRSSTVYAVGWIQPDGTVKGGTGWGVELAKLFNRPVFVFDQGVNQWMTWNGNEWEACDPKLKEETFGATGTRNLSPEGEAAIEALFKNSLS